MIRFYAFISIMIFTSTTYLQAQRNHIDKLYRIFQRLAGTPPTQEEIEKYGPVVEKGDYREVIDYVLYNHPSFINKTVKTMVLPWTNENDESLVPLNDYAATVMGMIRDDKPFNTVLSANLIYVADTVKISEDYDGAQIPPLRGG